MKIYKILYSSSSLYLTFPQFRSLIPELKDFKHILLNVNEFLTKKIDNIYIKERNGAQIFDIFINPIFKDRINFDTLNSYRRYKKILYIYLYKINPDAIISGSDLSVSDKVMFSWCKKKKIPFIILQPSFINSFPEKSGLIKMIKYVIINRILGLPVFRKYNLYGSESQKSYLFLWSKYFIINPKRKNTIILGNPAFDNLFKSFSHKREIKNTILICTENLPVKIFGKDMLYNINKIILKAIISKPDIKFYIKVHPRESIEKYKKQFPKNKFPNVNVVKDQDLYELFNLSDIQISVASFTSFEAAAKGLPIITIRPDNKMKVFDHFKKEIDIRVNNAEQIVEAINLIYSKKYWNLFLDKREKYFKKILYSTDGQSSKRVASAIRKLLLANQN